MDIAKGEILRRIRLNRKRLNDEMYRYPKIFTLGEERPGDWTGRGILALVSLYKALEGYKEEQLDVKNQLDEIFLHLDEFINQDGYLGKVFDFKILNEQQVSGNSWFLRGLIGYYKLTKNSKILNLIKKIFDNFILKLLPFYDKYNNHYNYQGEVSGRLSNVILDCWQYSTDIGCAFIMLDSVGSYLEINPSLELLEFANHLINKFMEIDYVEKGLQTHATLSCCRGILKCFEVSKNEKYLNYAKEIFENYLKYGMTLDYSNFNWFNKIDTWTEPCAIIDSFIVCTKLYKYTKLPKYQYYLNRIYFNALRGAQRSNGGAGCNTCLSSVNNELKVHLYEAFFCCTMRFGEGIYFINKNVLFNNKEYIDINLLTDHYYEDEGKFIEINGNIYEDKVISIKTNFNKPLRIYLSEFIDVKSNVNLVRKDNYLLINNPSEVKLEINYQKHQENKMNFVGDMILTLKNKENTYSKIASYIELDKEEALKLTQHL